MMMGIEIHLPQLEALLNRDAQNRDLLKSLIEKVDALAAAISKPAEQLDLPFEAPKPAEPKPSPKKRARKQIFDVEPAASNGDARDAEPDNAESEDDLRARVTFESRRITRVMGVGAMRAVIRKVTGESILQVDDVPAARLPLLLAELQAM
jgi:hypothetical protein